MRRQEFHMAKIKAGQYVPGVDKEQGEQDTVGVKRFSNGKAYIVVGYYALNAGGIIGSEYNGIAVIDSSEQRVVFDGHLPNSSIAIRNAWIQNLLSDTVDWAKFAKICTGMKRYRGGFLDLNHPENGPGPVDHVAQMQAGVDEPKADGPDIRLPISRDIPQGDGSKYDFPCATREQMTDHLINHAYHTEGHATASGYLSWNIKPGCFDDSGHYDGVDVDTKRDSEWQKYLQSDEGHEVFDEACESGLRAFMEGEYQVACGGGADAQAPAMLEGAEFSTTGRSGGHLILTGWAGPGTGSHGRNGNLRFNDRRAVGDFAESLSDAELAGFYHLVASLDDSLTTANINAEMAYQYADYREQWEERTPVAVANKDADHNIEPKS
jgi:hypothetical protein